MGHEDRRLATRERSVPLRMLGVIGCVVCLGWAFAMADEGAEEAIPPEYAGKVLPAGMGDDSRVRVTGKEIYEGVVNPEINCARCHGIDGKPTKLGKGAPDLSDPALSTKHSDARWFWRISEKKPGSKMPGYKDKLSEEQRWEVIAYLRILAQSGR
ncbi:MAG TPA: cytochrome c [Nitrospira sp.]|nr:cytochrome c [Nitrospira sp.]